MSSPSHLAKLAALAHEAMTLSEKPIYAEVADGSLAHPGFIGDKYDFSGRGTLVIGMNRGGSAASVIDVVERGALTKLKQGVDPQAYAELSRRSFELLSSWRVWKNNLCILLKMSGVLLQEVAYIHAVPFRFNDNASLTRLYKKVWADFTIRQFETLNPGRVLFAGKGVGLALRSMVGEVPSRIVPRTGRDIALPNHDGVAHARQVAKAHDNISTDAAFWKSQHA